MIRIYDIILGWFDNRLDRFSQAVVNRALRRFAEDAEAFSISKTSRES